MKTKRGILFKEGQDLPFRSSLPEFDRWPLDVSKVPLTPQPHSKSLRNLERDRGQRISKKFFFAQTIFYAVRGYLLTWTEREREIHVRVE